MALCGQLGCPIQLRRKEGCGSLILATFNDRFGDMRCVAAANLLHLQSNAALAIAASAKGGFVRTADLYAKRGEGPLSTLCRMPLPAHSGHRQYHFVLVGDCQEQKFSLADCYFIK
jgi:hypothetical protein